MSKTVWHPVSELPPLHEESFEDSGMIFRSMVSGQLLFLLSFGDMRIGEFERSGSGDHWYDDGGIDYTGRITHWAFLPELPEGVSHG